MPETTVATSLQVPSYSSGNSTTLECSGQLPGPPDPTGAGSLTFTSNPIDNTQGTFAFDPNTITNIVFDMSASPATFTCNVTVTRTDPGRSGAKMGWDPFTVDVNVTYPIPQ